MEQPGGVAAKRRVLVDALSMCLERSKVSDFVDAATLRTVLDSASGEMWREGEFRLDTVWKILTQQPGLSAKEVAPPLLVFKAYEEELGVVVRLPQALTAVPRSEQVRLRDELNISKADFAKSVGELQSLARAEQDQKARDQQAAGVEQKSAPAQTAKTPGSGRMGGRKPMSKSTATAILGFALVVCSGSLYFTLRSNAEPGDFSDVAPLLRIVGGEHAGDSWTGKIDDPRWDKLTLEERQTLATQLFDHESAKGVKVLMLLDASGEVRVSATYLGGKKLISAH